MDDAFADIDALAKHLPQPSVGDLLRLRREAGGSPPPLTTMPMPAWRPDGIQRYYCPLGCGWKHDEDPGVEMLGPLLLPADFTGLDVSNAITAMAEVHSNNYRLRVEQAIAAHFANEHPGR
ncbi:MAG: hypothetical protein LBV60_10610 [Streptomyces sp.]|jgi:hypothetical protein|nr:hypothetical protein [Streptomyces sp.]